MPSFLPRTLVFIALLILFSCSKVQETQTETEDTVTTISPRIEVSAVEESEEQESVSATEIMKDIILSSNYNFNGLNKEEIDLNIDPYKGTELEIELFNTNTRDNLNIFFKYNLEKSELSAVNKQGMLLQKLQTDPSATDNLLTFLGFEKMDRSSCITDTIDFNLPFTNAKLDAKKQQHRLKCPFNELEKFRCGGDLYYSTLVPKSGFKYIIMTQNCGESEFDYFYTIKDGAITDRLLIAELAEAMEEDKMEMTSIDFNIDTLYNIHLKYYISQGSARNFIKEEKYLLSDEGKFERR